MKLEKEDFEMDADFEFAFHSYGDDVDEAYGADFVTITDEDIRELKQGKIALFYPQGEYSVFLRYKEV